MTPLDRPIFVVGTPQAGTTFVHRALGELPGVVSLDTVARNAFDHADELRPALAGHDSHRRTATDASAATVSRIREHLAAALTAGGEGEGPGRFVDGAPRHALRIPFLDAVFPDATFVYVYRSPRETIGGMIEAWRSGEFVTHPNLPDWPGPPWSMLLIPGWRSLAGMTVAEIATEQWTTATRIMLNDLQALPPERWAVADFAALLTDPAPELERLAAVLDLQWSQSAALTDAATYVLRASNSQAVEDELQRLLPQTIGLAETAHDLLAQPVSRRPTATPDFEAPTRSVHNAAFARALDRRDSSLLLTTGATGKLVCVRHDGARVNTHFTDLPAARALAVADREFAVVGGDEVQLYRDDPDACDPGPDGMKFDACFVAAGAEPGLAATAVSYAADVLWVAEGVEMAPAGGGARSWRLPFADSEDGPQWRISGIAAGADGPRYVCAEETEGVHRGCVVDCATNEVLADGLLGPRAPRLGEDCLWLVEREASRLISIDLETRELKRVADLPGWPRGLVLAGSAAFVALARIRLGAADSSAGEPADPYSGVALIDLESGAEAGYLRFAAIPAISDVALLGHRYPEVARRR